MSDKFARLAEEIPQEEYTNSNEFDDPDLETGDTEFNSRSNDHQDKESLISAALKFLNFSQSITNPTTSNSRSQDASMQIPQQTPLHIGKNLKERIVRFEPPLKKLMVYTAIFLILKFSRVILVLGLLVQLFTGMTCEKSNIQWLLIAAFLRDIISSVLDMRLILQIYEMRYKIRELRFDRDLKEFARDVVTRSLIKRNHKPVEYQQQQQLSDSHTHDIYNVSFLEIEEAILRKMDWVGYSINVLKYCYYLLFVVSALFLLQYDDAKSCIVFEKYAIIYLFLPIYFGFLLIALSVSFFGVLITIIILAGLAFLAKMAFDQYHQSQNEALLENWANSLTHQTYESFKQSCTSNAIETTLETPSVCAICETPFLPSDSVTQLKCGHIFHIVCAQKQIRVHGSCAQCP